LFTDPPSTVIYTLSLHDALPIWLRPEYTRAEVGITGGNFLIADVGAVCVSENEGNARLSTSFPKVHIAIIGIEKILPSIQDLARSEEHTSELQSRENLVCRLLLE